MLCRSSSRCRASWATDRFRSRCARLLACMRCAPARRHCGAQDALASEALDLALKSTLLRDELYCQVFKQLRRNKKVPSVRVGCRAARAQRTTWAQEDSVLRGWQLLALACETFPPSDVFMPFALHFLQSHGTLRCALLRGRYRMGMRCACSDRVGDQHGHSQLRQLLVRWARPLAALMAQDAPVLQRDRAVQNH